MSKEKSSPLEPGFVAVPHYLVPVREKIINSNEKLFLSYILSWQRDGKECTASNQYIAEKIGVVPRTLTRMITKLNKKPFFKSAPEHSETGKGGYFNRSTKIVFEEELKAYINDRQAPITASYLTEEDKKEDSCPTDHMVQEGPVKESQEQQVSSEPEQPETQPIAEPEPKCSSYEEIQKAEEHQTVQPSPVNPYPTFFPPVEKPRYRSLATKEEVFSNLTTVVLNDIGVDVFVTLTDHQTFESIIEALNKRLIQHPVSLEMHKDWLPEFMNEEYRQLKEVIINHEMQQQAA